MTGGLGAGTVVGTGVGAGTVVGVTTGAGVLDPPEEMPPEVVGVQLDPPPEVVGAALAPPPWGATEPVALGVVVEAAPPCANCAWRCAI